MSKRCWKSKTCALVLACGIFTGGWTQYTPLRMRTVMNLNPTWKFIKQDVGVAQGAAISDPAGWCQCNLPHSFDIPYWRAAARSPPGVGWYRKHLTVDPSVIAAKKRVFIEFEAAFQIANVYVNGTFVGQHKGGYTGFSFDITQNVKAGDNVVAVHLDAPMDRYHRSRRAATIFLSAAFTVTFPRDHRPAARDLVRHVCDHAAGQRRPPPRSR